MKWEKLGLVHVANAEQPWAQTHAFLPTPMMLDDERIRVFVAFLDENRVGRVGWVDVSASAPTEVLAVSKRPALDIGAAGTFDDNGVTPIWILRRDGRIYLYYNGWQLGTRVRYFLFTGLAVSDDDGETFRRVSEVPLLDRSDGELYVRTAPCVMEDGDRWRMWYIGGDRWTIAGGKEVPSYDLRYLESDDPTRWGRRGHVCIAAPGGDVYGFGRPWVIKDGERFRMWYSVRSVSRRYHLGYAESSDGMSWVRRDEEVGIDVSPTGWDSEMICYSAVQATRFGTYLFYNGNGYGETGFGVARRVTSPPR